MKVVRVRSSDAGDITSKPMLIGYARVSTVDQNLALQRDALTEAGCAKIFIEQMSGAVADRPALHDALEFARSGDTLIVWKLDRLARSMKGSLPTRPPLLQPTRSYHWPGDAKRRMHRVRDRLDQRRGVGIEVERDGADHLTVLYNGVVRAPMGVVWNKLAIHWALVDGRDEV